MINFRNNKGITLVAEVITIVILIIIVSMITYSSRSSLQIKDLNNMYSDITNIQEKAINYYFKYGEAPVAEKVQDTLIPSDQKNPNDINGEYYKVDMSKLLNITLNNKQSDEEFYVMNARTLTTYYVPGVEIDNLNGGEEKKNYCTLPSNYEETAVIDTEKYQLEKQL